MKKNIAEAAEIVLLNTGRELISLYTRTALALNSFDVTAKGYASRKDDFQLSTTQNIPARHRLPIEIDVIFKKQELVEQYQGALLQGACQDFVIRMVSVLDAGIEEIFEVALETLEPDLPANRRVSRIRSAWSAVDDGRTEVAKYLIENAGLLPPPDKLSTVDMVFDRYCEIREIRHALVHNGGALAPKNLARLAELRDRLPEPQRTGSLANAPFLAEGRVQLGLHEVLGIRNWAYNVILGYLGAAFRQSYEAMPAG